MWWRVLIIGVLMMALFPMAAHAQSDAPLVTVSLAESEVQPGGTITITWVASPHLRRFHHVSIELWHAVLYQSVKLTSRARSGTIEMTVPDNFYDQAVVEVYPEKSNNQRYVDAANQTILAEADVVVNDGVEIVSFTISPNPVQRGQAVTVAWEVVNANGPAPQVTLIYPGEQDFYENDFGLPAVGYKSIPIPAYYTETFTVSLIAEKTMGAFVETTLVCPFDEYLGPRCPIEQNTVSLSVQYFTGGIFVTWGDQVYVLNNNRTASFRDLQTGDLTGITPPEGFYLPAPQYAGVWLEYQATYGFAFSPIITYQTTLEIQPGTSGRHKALVYWFRLPDESLIGVNPMNFGWTVMAE